MPGFFICDSSDPCIMLPLTSRAHDKIVVDSKNFSNVGKVIRSLSCYCYTVLQNFIVKH